MSFRVDDETTNNLLGTPLDMALNEARNRKIGSGGAYVQQQHDIAAVEKAKGAVADEQRRRAFAAGQADINALGDEIRAGMNSEEMAIAQQQARGENLVSERLIGQGIGQAVEAQRSLAASARPGAGALAGRTAAQNIGALNAQAVQQGTIAGLQEQRAASEFIANQRAQANQQLIQLQELAQRGLLSREELEFRREALEKQLAAAETTAFENLAGLAVGAAPIVGMALGGPGGAAAGAALGANLGKLGASQADTNFANSVVKKVG